MRKGSLPHARGGVSSGLTLSNTGLRSSPRTWGCFSCASCSFRRKDVFPTHVGVFPVTSMATEWKARLPHARGGVSKFGSYHVRQQGSSPRTWGCFWSGPQTGWRLVVFPTHVGVFLNSCLCRQSRVSLPHARGGVSLVSDLPRIPWESSPRTWGCFFHILHIRPLGKVFPTHVGVFLKVSAKRSGSMRLPHARGGVSGCVIRQHELDLSSPRTWGCF